MNGLAVVIAATLCCSTALADDNLHPEGSAWSTPYWQRDADYVVVLHQALPEAFAGDVRARMIAENYGYPEEALGVRGKPGAYRIFSLHSDTSLWIYTPYSIKQDTEPGHAPPVRNVSEAKIARCEFPIDDALAARILDAWKKMLLDTKYYEKPHTGVDGSSYHFWYPLEYDVMAGQIWSPEDGTRSAMLVEIAYAMDKACTAKDAESITSLNVKLDALLKKLP